MASTQEHAAAASAAAEAKARAAYASAKGILENPEMARRLIVGASAMPFVMCFMLYLLRFAKRSGEKQDEAIMEQVSE